MTAQVRAVGFAAAAVLLAGIIALFFKGPVETAGPGPIPTQTATDQPTTTTSPTVQQTPTDEPTDEPTVEPTDEPSVEPTATRTPASNEDPDGGLPRTGSPFGPASGPIGLTLLGLAVLVIGVKRVITRRAR